MDELPVWAEERIGIDTRLQNAETQARESGNITPILKEELWTKIQANRLARGLDEIRVEFKTPAKNELTRDEEAKAQIRRNKNREAAVRCRQKRKLKHVELENTLAFEKERNIRLKEKINQLQSEKQSLMSLLGVEPPEISPSAMEWPPAVKSNTGFPITQSLMSPAVSLEPNSPYADLQTAQSPLSSSGYWTPTPPPPDEISSSLPPMFMSDLDAQVVPGDPGTSPTTFLHF